MSRLAAQREGIHAALWRAKEAAGEKDVRLGGVETIQQFLRAGLMDEMHHARRAGPERGVIELTHDSYGDFVRRHRLAVVHFWAAWNGYDAQMKSFLETEIPGEWRDRVAVGTIDTDRSEHLGDLWQAASDSEPSVSSVLSRRAADRNRHWPSTARGSGALSGSRVVTALFWN